MKILRRRKQRKWWSGRVEQTQATFTLIIYGVVPPFVCMKATEVEQGQFGSASDPPAEVVTEVRLQSGPECDGLMVFSLTVKQILHSSNKRKMSQNVSNSQSNVTGPNNSNVVAGRVFDNLYEVKILNMWKSGCHPVCPTDCSSHLNTKKSICPWQREPSANSFYVTGFQAKNFNLHVFQTWIKYKIPTFNEVSPPKRVFSELPAGKQPPKSLSVLSSCDSLS